MYKMLCMCVHIIYLIVIAAHDVDVPGDGPQIIICFLIANVAGGQDLLDLAGDLNGRREADFRRETKGR